MTCILPICFFQRPATIYGGQQNFGEAENFTQEIEKHMIADFAIFELHLNPRGHVFGALAFRLLGINQVSSAMQRLKVILTRSTVMLSAMIISLNNKLCSNSHVIYFFCLRLKKNAH